MGCGGCDYQIGCFVDLCNSDVCFDVVGGIEYLCVDNLVCWYVYVGIVNMIEEWFCVWVFNVDFIE